MPKYALAFEEHLDPIKKRGKVVLDGAIPEGASIQVIRKTPIETEFLAQALKPLPTEALEHALDKICYIQQEIEGHLCDCRGEEYPGTPGEGEPPGGLDAPECQPYSCNAYVEQAIAAGLPVTDFPELRQPSPIVMPDPPYFSLNGPDGDSTLVQFQAGFAGATLAIDQIQQNANQYYAWPISFYEGSLHDVCNADYYGLCLGENTFASPQGWKIRINSASVEGVGMIHWGVFSDSSNGDNYFRRRVRVTGDVTGVSDFWIGVARSYSPGPGTQFRNIDSNGSNNFGDLHLDGAGVNHTYWYAKIGTPYLDGGSVWRLPTTVGVVQNGVTSEYTQNRTVTNSSNTTVTAEFLPSVELMAGCEIALYSMVMNDKPDIITADDLYTFYLQNFEGYEPPPECQFIGDEI